MEKKNNWFYVTVRKKSLPSSQRWRGEAALPSLVGKVSHAKRVTDELSSRFTNNSVPLNRKTVES